MDKKKFKEEIEEAIYFFDEYFNKVEVEYDFEDEDYPRATLKIRDHCNRDWEAPLCASKNHREREIVAIEVGEYSYDELDSESLFRYLWFEAASDELRRVTERLNNLE